ncbi:MAG TPA: DUF2865 domain-containing protein [Hyphomicrobiales bacterium]|nr:DUF2865 domain-containing protein [Hyphomicrobiales bacterium]
MGRLWRLAAMTMAAWGLGAAAAAAQPLPPACVALQNELARLNAASGPDPRYRAAIERQRYELARARQIAGSMHCGGGGFLFGPSPAPECPEVQDRIAQMQQNLRALSGRGGGAVDPRIAARRDDVIAALQQNGCGGGATQPAVAPRRRGLFDFLFGGGGGGEQQAPQPNGPVTLPEEQAPPQSSTYRTVCVRLGDGFFYPISFATSRANFERDAAICRRTCPGTQAELFAYPNPGGSIADAVSVNGEPYKDLPNAFLYQKKYVEGLSCKPAGETWAQALAGADTGLHGDQSAGNRGAGSPIVADPGASSPPPRRGQNARRVPRAVDDAGVADEAPPPGLGGGDDDDDVTSAPLAPLH